MTDDSSDFAAMFEASLKPRRLETGQTIEGAIVAIRAEVAFIDVGGKGEATIDIAELKDDDGNLEVAVGDRIQAVVTATSPSLTLSRRLARGAASSRQIEDAFRSGLPVEGKVERAVKGGYEIRIARQRAFCPASQIDTTRSEAPAHEGRVYTFRILEYQEGGRKFVVSRRAILEEEQRARAATVRESIVPGAILTGHVASVRDFGAFVDLGGGIQGLLHVSEIGWSRVSDPAQILKAGEEITVKVLRVEPDGQKIALGLKQLTDDPWSSVATRFQVGQVLPGLVTRLTEFGAFVEIEPGVEALAHASTFPPGGRTDGWKRAVPIGTKSNFQILSIDAGKKRIGVALVPEGGSRAARSASADGAVDTAEAEDLREYQARTDAAPSDGFGSLASKLRGALGTRDK